MEKMENLQDSLSLPVEQVLESLYRKNLVWQCKCCGRIREYEKPLVMKVCYVCQVCMELVELIQNSSGIRTCLSPVKPVKMAQDWIDLAGEGLI